MLHFSSPNRDLDLEFIPKILWLVDLLKIAIKSISSHTRLSLNVGNIGYHRRGTTIFSPYGQMSQVTRNITIWSGMKCFWSYIYSSRSALKSITTAGDLGHSAWLLWHSNLANMIYNGFINKQTVLLYNMQSILDISKSFNSILCYLHTMKCSLPNLMK